MPGTGGDDVPSTGNAPRTDGTPGEAPGTAGAAAQPGGRGGRRRKKGGPPNRGVPGHPEHRTGDPIIPPGGQSAALTAALALALAAAAAIGRPAVAVVVVLLQAVTAAGWYRLNGMWPARQGIALGFLAGLSAVAALFLSSDRNAATAVAGVLGIWVLLVLLFQLRNHGAPDERLYGLTVAVGATVLTVLAAAHLAAQAVSADAVVVGGVAVAVAVCVRALPLPGLLTLAAAPAVAAGAGAAAGTWTDLGAGAGALLGLGAGGGALIGLRAASYDWPSRFVHLTAGVALPLALAGPVVYLLGRVVG
ncbi:hypothetical protein JGS22_011255 [Streptomyces sp. P38-E01]|uniref:Uncharacterized protein n=1 Tax=Streptomyces tardus TaxID=2780544 RepID=A0A949N855_9ACTN|nr:hypothetical protein [Streptomyces tardus]